MIFSLTLHLLHIYLVKYILFIFIYPAIHSLPLRYQDMGKYDVAARHGVAPWKQGMLCGLLAAWDIFVNCHSLQKPSNSDTPEVVLGRSYVLRAKSLHKVLETLRDAWAEDLVHVPSAQLCPRTAAAGGIHGDLVPAGMAPFPATQLMRSTTERQEQTTEAQAEVHPSPQNQEGQPRENVPCLHEFYQLFNQTSLFSTSLTRKITLSHITYSMLALYLPASCLFSFCAVQAVVPLALESEPSLDALPAFPAHANSGDEIQVKTPENAIPLTTGYGDNGVSVQVLETGQKMLFADREICQITAQLGKPVVTWPMVQNKLRKVVEDKGTKKRGGVSKRQWETVMETACKHFPIATMQHVGDKSVQVTFCAPPPQAAGRNRCVYYHNLLMDCCRVTGREFRQLLAVDAQQTQPAKRRRQDPPAPTS